MPAFVDDIQFDRWYVSDLVRKAESLTFLTAQLESMRSQIESHLDVVDAELRLEYFEIKEDARSKFNSVQDVENCVLELRRAKARQSKLTNQEYVKTLELIKLLLRSIAKYVYDNLSNDDRKTFELRSSDPFFADVDDNAFSMSKRITEVLSKQILEYKSGKQNVRISNNPIQGSKAT